MTYRLNLTAVLTRTGAHFRRIVPILWLICLMPVSLAFAQDAENDDTRSGSSFEIVSPQIDVNTQEEIDEITVVGPRSLVLIERQIERADFALYAIANTLIDDPLYKTYCHRETSAGSNIKRRVCAAGFERELMSEAWEEERAMGRMGESNYTFNYKLPESELRQYRENLKQKMIELAAGNPELAAAIYERAQLQRDYEWARRSRLQNED